MQARLGKLEAYCSHFHTRSVRSSIPSSTVRQALEYARPPADDTATLLLQFLRNVAADPGGCDKVIEAGALPVVFGMLNLYPDDARVSYDACELVSMFLQQGFKSEVMRIPGFESSLRVAASGTNRMSHSAEPRNQATVLLWKMGLLGPDDDIVSKFHLLLLLQAI